MFKFLLRFLMILTFPMLYFFVEQENFRRKRKEHVLKFGWLRKKQTDNRTLPFDRNLYEAVLRCNTCNSEKVACFREKESGILHEIMPVGSREDLLHFLEMYGIKEDELKKIY